MSAFRVTIHAYNLVIVGRFRKLSLALPDIVFERRKATELYAWLDAIIPQIKGLQTPELKSKPQKEWTVLEAFADENASNEVFLVRSTYVYFILTKA